MHFHKKKKSQFSKYTSLVSSFSLGISVAINSFFLYVPGFDPPERVCIFSMKSFETTKKIENKEKKLKSK